MVVFHLGALAALFFFSWHAFLLAMVLWWVAGGFGIGMRYHRLLTHRGHRTPKWVEYVLTVCGTLALEGGPIFWVATHRMHHQNTDKEGDPHSPREGGLWAHMGWILTGQTMHNDAADLLPYVPDLRKDKFHVWISRWHWVPITTLGRSSSLRVAGNTSSKAYLSHGHWPALHLTGEFRHPYVGKATVSHRRYL
jgi:stearoyl-CoA desaturase (delta-9 desaturase)